MLKIKTLCHSYQRVARGGPGLARDEEKDALNQTKRCGARHARVLACLSGFCQDSRDAAQVATLQPNCYRVEILGMCMIKF